MDGESKNMEFALKPVYANNGMKLWACNLVPVETNQAVVITVNLETFGEGYYSYIKTNFGYSGTWLQPEAKTAAASAMFTLPGGRYAVAVLSCFVK